MSLIGTCRKGIDPLCCEGFLPLSTERFSKRKNIYSKEDNNSSDNDTDSENELEKVLFMAIGTKENLDNHEGSEEEREVDLEGEIIIALEELDKERKKNKLLKKALSKIKECT